MKKNGECCSKVAFAKYAKVLSFFSFVKLKNTCGSKIHQCNSTKNAFCRYTLNNMGSILFLVDWTKSQNRSSGGSLQKLQIEAKYLTIHWILPSSAVWWLFENNVQHPHFYTFCIILSGLRLANRAAFVNHAYFWIWISLSSSRIRQEPNVKVLTLQILQRDWIMVHLHLSLKLGRKILIEFQILMVLSTSLTLQRLQKWIEHILFPGQGRNANF